MRFRCDKFCALAWVLGDSLETGGFPGVGFWFCDRGDLIAPGGAWEEEDACVWSWVGRT